MSGNTVVTNVPFPPGNTQVSEAPSGTITNISCPGPVTATVYSAAGVVLLAISSPIAINMPVSIAFTGGPAYVKQSTPSSITLSF